MRGERAKQDLKEQEGEITSDEIEIIDISEYKPRKIPPPVRAGPEHPARRQHQPPDEQLDLFDDGWPGFEEPYITYD